jgi:HK97 family phage major capsid protein
VAKEWIELLKSYAFMRREASQITTERGEDMGYPTSDGTSEIGELVPQSTQASGADASFGTRALNCYKFGSKIITIPIELLQDTSIDILALIYGRMRDRIGRSQNVYFTTGTGTAQPFGLTVAASVGKTGTTGQTTTIIYDDLVDMVDSLDVAYLDNPDSNPSLRNPEPCWMFSQTLRKTLRKLKDTAGRPLWTPSYDQGIGASTHDLLMGYPVCINNDMPTPAANAKSLAFGNLKRYMIRDAMQVSMFRFDDSAYMSKGQVGFLAWARAGGNLMDLNSVKTYQHSAT